MGPQSVSISRPNELKLGHGSGRAQMAALTGTVIKLDIKTTTPDESLAAAPRLGGVPRNLNNIGCYLQQNTED